MIDQEPNRALGDTGKPGVEIVVERDQPSGDADLAAEVQVVIGLLRRMPAVDVAEREAAAGQVSRMQVRRRCRYRPHEGDVAEKRFHVAEEDRAIAQTR